MPFDHRDDPTDQALLVKWRGGDKQAGQELFHRYYDRVERFFINKVSTGAEDLVHETFVGCVKGHARIQDTSKFSQYLFKIAYNVLNTELRRRYRRGPDWPIEQVSVEDIAPGPVTILTGKQEERLLLMALRQIPVQSQVILELHYWEGKTMAEIAEIVDIPAGTAKSRMRSARAQLREAIAALDESPELVHSTQTNLHDWAERCRRLLARLDKPGPGY